MTQKYFNFNNEADLTPIEVDEDGRVTLTVDGHASEFESVTEFAEFYAVARNVKPENLKNWVLTEDADQYAYVLQAGTAGLDAEAISAMATGLRSAGMTPSEIGAAIAAAQAQDETTRTVARTNDEYSQFIRDELQARNDHEIAALFEAFDVASLEELQDAIHADTSLFTEVNDDYYEDNYDEDDLEPDEILHANLNQRIDEASEQLEEALPNVPFTVQMVLTRDAQFDSVLGKDAFDKAAVVAQLAHRSLAVVLVYNNDDNEDLVASTDFFNANLRERLAQFDNVRYFVADKKFVIAV